jgi:hypothetical protein
VAAVAAGAVAPKMTAAIASARRKFSSLMVGPASGGRARGHATPPT